MVSLLILTYAEWIILIQKPICDETDSDIKWKWTDYRS